MVDGSDALVPIKTELNQAILCDDLPTLSSIQMGPTGRSVARSYANAIGKLVPAGVFPPPHTISADSIFIFFCQVQRSV